MRAWSGALPADVGFGQARVLAPGGISSPRLRRVASMLRAGEFAASLAARGHRRDLTPSPEGPDSLGRCTRLQHLEWTQRRSLRCQEAARRWIAITRHRLLSLRTRVS